MSPELLFDQVMTVVAGPDPDLTGEQDEIFIIGIDGGGTQTRGLLVDGQNRVLASVSGGPSNYQVVGAERAGEVIRQVLSSLSKQAGIPLRAVTRVVIGLAGAGRQKDRQLISSLLAPLSFGGKVLVTSDGIIALLGGTGGRPGLVIISGTGSLVMGINEKGEIYRAGGWGPIIGDEGSGYDIGRRALQLVAKSCDRRGPRTRLTEIIQRQWQLDDFSAVLERVNTPGARTEIAALTTAVVAAAEQDDPAARRILLQAARELALAARAVGRQCGFIDYRGKRIQRRGRAGLREVIPPEGAEPVPVVLSGGVFAAAEDYLRPVLAKELPWARLLKPQYPPVSGAIILGWHSLGQPARPDLANLSAEKLPQVEPGRT